MSAQLKQQAIDISPDSAESIHQDETQQRKLSDREIPQRLRLLSYNIQTGTSTANYRHYLTRSWRQLLPNTERMNNLSNIARVVADYDVIGLQEVDAGSLRSGFINQTEYIADKAQFPYWFHQTNRRLGKLAQHSNGVVSRFRPLTVDDHKLPGPIPGRGAMFVYFGSYHNPLVIVIMHLALGKRTRLRQLSYVASQLRKYEHVIVMGDLNCPSNSIEVKLLINNANLREPKHDLLTFPSWNPERNIDHILVSPSLRVEKVSVLNCTYSDHLPIAMEVILPESFNMKSGMV